MRAVTAIALFLAVFTERLDLADGKNYSVFSPSCRLLDLDPFDDTIAGLYQKRTATTCSLVPPLTSVSQVSRSHILHLHKENFHHYSPDGSPIDCVRDEITRIQPNERGHYEKDAETFFTVSNLLPLNGDVTFVEDTEFVSVRCFLSSNYGTAPELVYTNMHAFIGFKPEVGRKINQNFENPNHSKKLGVMIIGFDSISRSNLIRTMPKTVRHLARMGWLNLKGYNKIEDNTFPNVMAILSGMSIQQLQKTCWYNQYKYLDDCPMIWKEFSKNGYITAYAEDSPHMSTFNCFKVGFRNPPTDYYMRPFFLAAKDLASGPCLGREKIAHHLFNYSIDFADCFHRYPTFSLFWHNSFSHNDGDQPSTMDDEVVDYFKRLAETGILNTTMVIFLSDHGMRVGALRETYVGHLEERLPFIYLWVPDWFKAAFPQKIQNLVSTTNALTSPYDVHMTLVDVLGGTTSAKGCPRCQSLFKPVPWNRSCKDAGITEHWCTCNEYIDVPNIQSSKALSIAESVVEEINFITSEYDECAHLQLKEIISLRQRTFGATAGEQYIVILKTTPGDAKFEATVAETGYKKSSYTGKHWAVLSTVSRINLYGGQSGCVPHYFVKEYCFCRAIKSQSFWHPLIDYFNN